MPLHHTPSDPALRVRETNDRLVLAQVPDDAAGRENGGENVLHLSVPRHRLDILKGLRFSAWSHRGGCVVEIPNEDLRFGRGRGEQIALEAIVVQGGDRSLVLVQTRHQTVLTGQHLRGVVDLNVSAFAATHNRSILTATRSERTPDDFVEPRSGGEEDESELELVIVMGRDKKLRDWLVQ